MRDDCTTPALLCRRSWRWRRRGGQPHALDGNDRLMWQCESLRSQKQTAQPQWQVRQQSLPLTFPLYAHTVFAIVAIAKKIADSCA